MLEQYDFQTWLQSLPGDTIVGKTNSIFCPIYAWLRSRGVPVASVGRYGHCLGHPLMLVANPQWAIDYIALLDTCYATRVEISAEQCLALLPTVPAPQRELVAV